MRKRNFSITPCRLHYLLGLPAAVGARHGAPSGHRARRRPFGRWWIAGRTCATPTARERWSRPDITPIPNGVHGVIEKLRESATSILYRMTIGGPYAVPVANGPRPFTAPSGRPSTSGVRSPATRAPSFSCTAATAKSGSAIRTEMTLSRPRADYGREHGERLISWT